MKDYVSENLNESSTEIKYYYPKETEFNSLRKSLKFGMDSKEIKVIRKFHCKCPKHQNIILVALVSQFKNTLTIRECEFTAQSEKIAINKEGKILFNVYEFYSAHPNWRVRVAVAVGLGKLKTQNAFNLLFSLLTDLHFGVVLAALQSLEKLGPSFLKRLCTLVPNINQKHVQFLVYRLIKKVRFGMCFDNTLEQSLKKLSKSQLVIKVPKKDKKTKILVPREIFYNLFADDHRKNYFNHWNKLNKGINKITNIIQLNGERILIKRSRFTVNNVKKNKINYIKSLFFRDAIPVNIKNILNPQQGEVYWSITDTYDPKITRPVLIMAPIDQKSGDIQVAPLTTDTLLPSDKNVIVDIANKKNSVQLWRQKIIHQSLLLNKYGEISKDVFEKLSKKIEELKQNSIFSKKNIRLTFIIKDQRIFPT